MKGPTWDTGAGTTFTKSNALTVDDFYVITPVSSFSLHQYFVAFAIPFRLNAWLGILFLILFLGVTLHIINPTSYHHHKPITGLRSLLHRLMHILYASVRSFATNDITDMKDDKPTLPEKIVAIGFVVFALLIISSYTGAVAAALVTNNRLLRYSSLDDIVLDAESVVCLYPETIDTFQAVVSGVDVIGINSTVVDILDRITDPTEKCSVAILPAVHYERAILLDSSYCANTQILLDSKIFSLSMHLYVSSFLGNTTLELLDAFNSFIDTGEYSKLDNSYLTFLRRSGYDYIEESRAERKLHDGSSLNELTNTYYDSLCDSHVASTSQLSSLQLLFPFVFTFVCTSIGLILFLCRRLQKKVRRQYRLKQGDAVPALSEKFHDEETFLMGEIIDMSTNEIIDDLLQRKVDRRAIEEAVDALPARTMLESLLLEERLSKGAKDFSDLKKLSTLRLYEIYKSHYLNISDDSIFTFDGLRDPKEHLVEQILSREEAKEAALSLLSHQLTEMSDNTESVELGSSDQVKSSEKICLSQDRILDHDVTC